MSVVHVNSISGITSITSPSSSDVLTLHTSNNAERVRILTDGKISIGALASADGNLHVHNSTAGSVTAASDANELVLESAANVGMSFLTANNSISRIKFGDTTATNRGIFYFNHSDASFNFQHGSDNRLKIDSTGQMGLGIAPVKPFNIVAGVGTTEFIRLSQPVDASVQQNFGIGWCSNNNHVWPGSQITSLEYDVSDTRRSLLFYTRGTNQDIAPTERMRISHDGNVAIGGYGDPASILDVRENKDGAETQIRLFNTDNGDTTTQTAALYLSPDSRGSAKTGIRAIKENASFATNAGRDISLTLNTVKNNAQVEAIRIHSSGLVGIGTITNWSPYKLQVAGGLGIAESANTGQQAMSITNNAIQTLAIGVAYNALLLNKDGGAVVAGGASAQASDSVTLMPDGEVTAAGFYFSNNIGSPMNSDGFRRHTTGTICIDTASAERLRINSSGNIGQGVTPSGWASAQAGDFFAYQVGSGMAIFGRGSGDEDRGGISCNYYHTASQQKYIGNGHAGRIYFEDGSIVFSNAAQNASGADQNMTLDERLRIDSSGRIGFGGLDPANYYSTYDDFVWGATSGSVGMTIVSGSDSAGYITWADGTSSADQYRGRLFYSHSDNSFNFRCNGLTNNIFKLDSSTATVNGTTDGVLNLDTTSSNGTFIRFKQGGTTKNWIGCATGIGGYGDKDDLTLLATDNIILATNSAKRIQIQNNGNTDIFANQVHLYNSVDTSNTYFVAQNTGVGNAGIKIKNSQGEWTLIANDRLRFIDDDANLERLAIESDGTVSVNPVRGYDNGTLRVYATNAGIAGVIAGGGGSGQSTGFMEVNQDGVHGGGMFYNGDGTPTFATGESADHLSLYRNDNGNRHVVAQWSYNSNNSLFKGDMDIDNGTSTLVRVTGDSAGTAGVSVGGDSGQSQCTGFVEVHQDRSHGGGISYNGDGSPGFVTGETADHITFYRIQGGARHRVFHYAYSDANVNFAGVINNCEGIYLNYNNTSYQRGLFRTNTSGQTSTNCPQLANNNNHYGWGYQEAYSTSGGGWSNPYPSLVMGYHTGMEFGGHPNYQGCRFYADHPSANRTIIMSVGNGGSGVHVVNTFTAGTKTFRIAHPHPSKKYTHDLVHSVIEGPQCDNIYRGKVDLVGGTATINIDTKAGMTDGTFVLLNRDIQCFTSNETGWGAVKGSVSGNILTITAQDNSSTDTISWMVVGERQDDKIKSPDVEVTDSNGKLIMEPLTIEETHL